MKLSRILGANMTLLFSLLYMINKTRGIKAAGCFYIFFVLESDFFSFLKQIIQTLPANGSCGYLYRSFLLSRLLTVGYSSNTINRIWGRIE